MHKPRKIYRMSYSLLTQAFSVINFNTEIIRWKSVKFRKIVSPKEIFWTQIPGFSAFYYFTVCRNTVYGLVRRQW